MVGGGGGGGGHGGGGGGGGHGGGGHGGHYASGGVFVAPPIGYSSRSHREGASSMADEAAPLLDESYQTFCTHAEYIITALYMLVVCTVFIACSVWPDWHASLIVVIAFSYSTAMALLLVRHCSNKQQREDQLELTPAPQCAPQSTWVLMMLVVTGIMIISLALTVSIFPDKRDDVPEFMFLSMVCAMFGFCFIHGTMRNG